jgi:hypothetical protein
MRWAVTKAKFKMKPELNSKYHRYTNLFGRSVMTKSDMLVLIRDK